MSNLLSLCKYPQWMDARRTTLTFAFNTPLVDLISCLLVLVLEEMAKKTPNQNKNTTEKATNPFSLTPG